MLSKKLILTATLVLSIIATSFVNVYASSNASGVFTLKEASAKATGTYKVGDEITVSVSVAVKEMDGINIILANVLGYDKDLLEYKGITLRKDWVVISDKGKIFIERVDLESDKGKLCELKFKVIKEFKETKIYLDKIDATSGDGINIHYLDGNVNSPSIIIKASEPAPSTTKVETQVKKEEPKTNNEQEKQPVQNQTQTTNRKDEVRKPEQEQTKPTQNTVQVEEPKTNTQGVENNIQTEATKTIENTQNVQEVQTVEVVETQIQDTTNKLVEQEVTKLAKEQNISEENMDNIMEIITSCVTKVVSAIIEAIFKTLSLSL